MFSLLRRQNPRPARPVRVRPRLESLEDRTVPTVVFKPAFGPETLVGTNDGMQNPNVYLIFSGSYWTNTAQGQQDEAALTQEAQSILSGPYLGGLTQYGASGTATYAGAWNDPNDVPIGDPIHNTPTQATLQGFLQSSITNQGAPPGANDVQHAPIYVVISDPAASAGNGGFNEPGTFTQWTYRPWGFGGRFGGGYFMPVDENIHMVWLGSNTKGVLNRDILTAALSHELAETISDPDGVGNVNGVQVVDPNNPNGRGQIADFEPTPAGGIHYGYRLNGVWVQPYWSAADQAFIVPDGNAQEFDLNPIWNPGYTVHYNGKAYTVPPTFTGQYNLVVRGDQLGSNYGDNIRIDSAVSYADNVNPVAVTMNGETVIFERNAIQNIRIDTVGGDNVVQVASLAARVSLNIDSTGYGSNDVVVVGDDNDSLANIHGPINVSNTSGQTTLVVDGGGDGPGGVQIGDSYVEFDNPTVGTVEISYNGGTGSGTGVTNLQVIDGVGENYVYVESTPPYTGVTLFGDSQDFIWGPAAGQVQFWGTHW